MRLSRRLGVIEPSATLGITARAAALRARGVPVLSFSVGEPDFDTPLHIKEAAKRALDAGATKYTPVEGTRELRAAAARWFSAAHRLPVDPSEVMVSSGAKQAIFNAVHALLDDGDEVLIPTPCWVSYTEIAKLAGGVPVLVPCPAERGFALDIEALGRAIGPRTRMLILGSPSNPTGAVFDEPSLRAVARLVVEHNLWLITDDIYRTLIYGETRFVEPATFSPQVRERTVVVDGVSKAYAMTGWRIGFALAPPTVVEAMAVIQGQCTTNAAAVSQAAALAALEGPQDEVESMRVEFNRRRQAMLAGLRRIPGLVCTEPHGAFYAFPDVRAFLGRRSPDGLLLADDGVLCEYLLDAAQVALVPGAAFKAPGHVRLSYATSLANIETGLGRIAAALAALRP